MTLVTSASDFFLFVDDYSRKMWMLFLYLKSNVFNKFQKFKALVEKESSCHITTFRFDNGGELYSKEFEIFCIKYDINKQFTIPYTPQQNGVVERWNRRITKWFDVCCKTRVFQISFRMK